MTTNGAIWTYRHSSCCEAARCLSQRGVCLKVQMALIFNDNDEIAEIVSAFENGLREKWVSFYDVN